MCLGVAKITPLSTIAMSAAYQWYVTVLGGGKSSPTPDAQPVPGGSQMVLKVPEKGENASYLMTEGSIFRYL